MTDSVTTTTCLGLPGHYANSCGYSLPQRRLLGLITVVLLTVLAAAAYVTPANGGTGSHMQLGLPECGTLARTGHPCITCGMTTAFALTVRGRLIQAFVIQPAGLCLAVGCGAVAGLCGFSLATGRKTRLLTALIDLLLFRFIFVAFLITGLLLAGWGWTWMRISWHNAL